MEVVFEDKVKLCRYHCCSLSPPRSSYAYVQASFYCSRLHVLLEKKSRQITTARCSVTATDYLLTNAINISNSITNSKKSRQITDSNDD